MKSLVWASNLRNLEITKDTNDVIFVLKHAVDKFLC